MPLFRAFLIVTTLALSTSSASASSSMDLDDVGSIDVRGATRDIVKGLIPFAVIGYLIWHVRKNKAEKK